MPDPWMKFYTSDWRSDPRLKMCSAGARGVWIEMICLMHEAAPYGHLLVHGQTPNEGQLASLTGIPSAELNQYLAELERMGVFSRTKEGVIYSRKLVRMAAKSAKARKNGKKGGNPSLGKETINEDEVNLKDKGEDKPQKPEARSQRVSADALSSPSRLDDAFDRFWNRYPRKVEKKAARKRFDQAVKAGADPERIVAGAAQYAGADTVQRGFIKHPTTWLNAGCWDDDISAPPSSQQPETDPRRERWRKLANGE